MAWVIVGLGNPGEEYQGTRHNTGRMALEFFGKQMQFGDWKEDNKSKAHVASGMIGKTAVVLVAPDTFMNKSGAAVLKFVKSQKAAERMVVVYDDLDLPIGGLKLSFNRGSGGHRGVESIMKAVKTKKFTRVRVGVSPETPGGKLKKPQGEDEVVKFILSKFSSKGGSASGGKPSELEILQKVFKKVAGALEAVVADGPQIAMNKFNSDAK
ncbi:aminoacyl-tRNA hydrolase [Candidatus Kaiserbacteria bacterium]|nr:aminoacyl-tRNA hydrolase [Candidatus Kaiserbacteria bacterium]